MTNSPPGITEFNKKALAPLASSSHCVCQLANTAWINAQEREVMPAGIQRSGHRAYGVGEHTQPFSPAKRHKLQRTHHLSDEAKLVEYEGAARRALDIPDINEELILQSLDYQTERMYDYVRQSPHYNLSQKRLDRTKAKERHRQPANILGYLQRCFCPVDARVVVRASDDIDIPEESELDMIMQLPLDPDRISDEAFQRLGLAPDGFEDMIEQSRRRVKLWSRERILSLLSQGEMMAGKEEHKTARIIEVRTPDGEIRWCLFQTIPRFNTNLNGSGGRHQTEPVPRCQMSVFESFEDLARSQDHATEALYCEIGLLGFFHETFMNFSTLSQQQKRDLILQFWSHIKRGKAFQKERFRQRLYPLAIRYGNNGSTPDSIEPEGPALTRLIRTFHDCDVQLTAKLRQIASTADYIQSLRP